MLAYGEGRQQVIPAHVKLAIKDTEAAYQSKNKQLTTMLSALVMMSILGAIYLVTFGVSA
jgi:MSHA biogenesis protein MshM